MSDPTDIRQPAQDVLTLKVGDLGLTQGQLHYLANAAPVLARSWLEMSKTDIGTLINEVKEWERKSEQQQALIDSQHEVLVNRGQLAIERQATIEQQQAEIERLKHEASHWFNQYNEFQKEYGELSRQFVTQLHRASEAEAEIKQLRPNLPPAAKE